MADQNKQKSIVESIWDFLASVKLAVIIFTTISTTSIVGTVIVQGGSHQENLDLLGTFVGDSMAPQAYDLLNALGFMDMYRSWWFIGLLMLFAINLIICSIDRIPPAWRAATEEVNPIKDEQFKSFPIKREASIKGKADDNRDTINSILKSMGFTKTQHTDVEGGYQLYGGKHSYSRLGVYITHLSILVIMIGAVIGVLFGFKGSLVMLEGEASAVAYKHNGYPTDQEQQNIAQSFLDNGADIKLTVNQLAKEYDRTPESIMRRIQDIGIEPLGFIVKCDDSAVTFYPKSYQPREYTSDLTVLDGVQDPFSKRIEVNDPLRHNSYTFYQSSHGVQAKPLGQNSSGALFYAPYPPEQHPEFILNVTPPGTSKPVAIRAKYMQPIELPGSKATATVTGFVPTYGGDQRRQGSMANLVVELGINYPDGSFTKYMAPQRAQQAPMKDGTLITAGDIWGIEYTGLSVRRDPGVWIVYFGCLLMSVGLYMAFFMSHRRIWVQATGSGGKTTLKIAGTAHKHRDGFERRIDRALGLLREGGQ